MAKRKMKAGGTPGDITTAAVTAVSVKRKNK